jgi:hypothetical protein
MFLQAFYCSSSSRLRVLWDPPNGTLLLFLRPELFGSRRRAIGSVSLEDLPSEEALRKKRKVAMAECGSRVQAFH